MSTCKDCLHYDACGGFTPTDLDADVFDYCRKGNTDEIPDIDKRCGSFKNKADYVEVKKVKTNFDRIKAMSVEELARLLCDCSECSDGRCYGNDLCTIGGGACNGLVKWLESEVQGGNE